VGGLCDDGSRAPCAAVANPVSTAPYQALFLPSGARWASTLGAAVSDNGNVYLLDLGHDGLANGRDWLGSDASGQYAQVERVTFTLVAGTHVQPALWNTVDATPPTPLSRDATAARSLVRATPGFTQTDTWTVSWQGALPGLAALGGQAQVGRDGTVAWIAIQSPTGLAGQPFTGVGRLYDPRLAIQPARPGRIGDIVQVTAVREPGDAKPIDTSVEPATAAQEQYCPFGTFELEVTDLLPPGDAYPGGAVAVRVPAWANWSQVTTTFGNTPAGASRAVTADPSCMRLASAFTGSAPAATALKPVTVSFLSGELLLTGLAFGYAGRPTVQADPAGGGFLVQHDEGLAGGTCPMLEGAAWPPPVCDDACRIACERLLLSRKARRAAYVYSRCATTDTACLARWAGDGSTTVNKLAFPNPTGPVLGLDLAWTYDLRSPVTPDLGDAAVWPPRGSLISIDTAGGLARGGFAPASGGTRTGTLLPNGVVAWNRPDFTANADDHVQIYASYPADLVLTFSPAGSPADVGLIH
jgi:hypothetical protein